MILYISMISKTLLGTLVKRHPHYMNLLMKSHPYEEVFHMNKQWCGIIEFSKKTGTVNNVYHKYISSSITILDKDTVYQEQIEYFLVPSMNTPTLMHPTWRKNKVKISSKEIPSRFFTLLASKHPSDMIYSSHPL